jgi:putative transposase
LTPYCAETVLVNTCGRIFFGSKKINPSQVFAGQKVGVREEGDGIWQVSFMRYEIGYFDLETCRVEPMNNPYGPQNVNHVSGMKSEACGW